MDSYVLRSAAYSENVSFPFKMSLTYLIRKCSIFRDGATCRRDVRCRHLQNTFSLISCLNCILMHFALRRVSLEGYPDISERFLTFSDYSVPHVNF